jgi:hypothetical protein
MITTIHARGVSRTAVVQQIKQRMEEEGYVEDPAAVPTGSPFETGTRQILIVEEGDWISLVDHPFATTSWAERLSRGLATKVVELAGECDHAFYSDAKLYDSGQSIGASRVPADAVLEDDGRHRIRPTFLGAIVPEAKAALEAGIVVNPLGGEENVAAVGEAMGIPHPLVHPSYPFVEDTNAEAGGKNLRLTFRQVKEPAADVELLPAERPFDMAAMMSELAKSLGTSLEASGITIGEDGVPVFGAMLQRQVLAGGGEDAVAELEASMPEAEDQTAIAFFLSVGPRNGIEGAECGGFTIDVSLASTALSAKGIEIDVWGDGLALLDPIDELATFPISLTGADAGASVRAKAEIVKGEGREIRRFRFPDVALVVSDKQRAKAAKPLPLGIQGAFNLGFMVGQEDKARICFDASSTLPRPGQGDIHVTVRLAEAEAARPEGRALLLEATEKATLEVRASARRPVLPSFARASAVDSHQLEEYASRKALNGWVGFAAPWSDVAVRVTPMIQDLVKMLREVSGLGLGNLLVRTEGGETLQFETGKNSGGSPLLTRRDATWAKLEAELMKGAEVVIDDTDRWSAEHRGIVCIRDGKGEEERAITSVSLSFGHRRPRKNAFDEPMDEVRVFLQWSITRPVDAKRVERVADVSRSIVLAAGHIAGNVGGFVTTGSYASSSYSTTPYEELLGLRMVAYKQTWCERHVRTPAWCVLAPPRAATELAGRETPARLWTTRTTHGLLICSGAADPFVYGARDAEAVERFVLPALGTADEVAAVRI